MGIEVTEVMTEERYVIERVLCMTAHGASQVTSFTYPTLLNYMKHGAPKLWRKMALLNELLRFAKKRRPAAVVEIQGIIDNLQD